MANKDQLFLEACFYIKMGVLVDVEDASGSS